MKILETYVIAENYIEDFNKEIAKISSRGFEPLNEAKLYFNSSSKVYVITMVKYSK